MAGYILDTGDLSTLVHTFSRPKDFSGSMSHYFASAGSSSGSNSNIVIALDPKAEESLSTNHIVVGLLVTIEGFSIMYIVTDITTTTSNYYINHIGA